MEQRIAIIVPGLGAGGTERAVVRIANALAALDKYKIDVVCIGFPQGSNLKELSSNIQVVPLNVANSWQDIAMIMFLASLRESFPLLLQYFHKYKPSIVLTNWFNSPLIWLKERYSLEFRVIIIEHMNFQTWQRNLRGIWGYMIMRWTCRHFYKKADAIVSVSKGVCNELVSLGIVPRNKAHYIYNPVVTSTLQIQAQEKVEHPWFKDNIPIIIAVGRLAPQKDFVTLLKAFHIVLKSMDARLIILGEGKERANLEKLSNFLNLNEKVDFYGYVSNPYAYISKAKIFVLSSMHEALAMVLIEAMACGITPVSTACPYGPEEVLDNGKYGYLVPVGDVNALSQAMLQAITKPFPQEKLIERAMMFTDSAAAVAYDALLTSFLHKAST